MGQKQQITLLGSTGSIGVSTLDVIKRQADRYQVFALTANTSVQALLAQVLEFKPTYAVMLDHVSADQLRNQLHSLGSETEVLSGLDNLAMVAAHPAVQQVMAAIVGAAGLMPTLAAVRAGKRVLLANKEALVMSGELFMGEVRAHGAELLPIDSEHNAIFQCLPQGASGKLAAAGVEKLLLTASGGPFRQFTSDQLEGVTPDQACAHPNWSMGRKISVDSATMMNKGLEFIEACWLFGAPAEAVEIVVHPQSVIHSMVQYSDGSVLAQLGNPDMRTPIAYGLAWPERIAAGVPLLDLVKVAKLEFEAPDEDRFPCLRLAREALAMGGTAPASLNAANEVAVQGFLENKIRFTAIPAVIEKTLTAVAVEQADSIERILAVDELSRAIAEQALNI